MKDRENHIEIVCFFSERLGMLLPDQLIDEGGTSGEMDEIESFVC